MKFLYLQHIYTFRLKSYVVVLPAVQLDRAAKDAMATEGSLASFKHQPGRISATEYDCNGVESLYWKDGSESEKVCA